MGMTLKELLTKGEGTLSAQEAKALAAQCRMDVDTLYTLLEERGIKVLEEENEPSLDVDSIIAEVENAENNNDDMGLADENEEDAEENPADLKAAMDELLDDPVKNYLKQIGQIPLLSAEQKPEPLLRTSPLPAGALCRGRPRRAARTNAQLQSEAQSVRRQRELRPRVRCVDESRQLHLRALVRAGRADDRGLYLKRRARLCAVRRRLRLKALPRLRQQRRHAHGHRARRAPVHYV